MPMLIFFFFNDTATTEIYTLSLHDALPIYLRLVCGAELFFGRGWIFARAHLVTSDRKSTRLNSSHSQISYAVFCLKKKKTRPGGMLPSDVPVQSHPCLELTRQCPYRPCT